MTNNDILRRIRYILDIKNADMIKIFKLSSITIDEPTLLDLLKKEDEEGLQKCSDELMIAFLNGLILSRRGPSDKKPDVDESVLSNNMILKKIRIALEIKEEEMLKILALGNATLSKYELSALFRKEGHKNYKTCGNQFLRNFLHGLAEHYRPSMKTEK